MVGERPTWCWANYWHLSCFGHDSALCSKRASMVANVRRHVGWIPGTESASTVSVPRRSFCWMSSAFVLLKSSSATIYASQLWLILRRRNLDTALLVLAMFDLLHSFFPALRLAGIPGGLFYLLCLLEERKMFYETCQILQWEVVCEVVKAFPTNKCLQCHCCPVT